MNVRKLPLRKKLALELHRRQKEIDRKTHPLRYLFWECTLRCNLACRHCGSDCRKDMQQQDMPADDFLKAIDSITPHVDPNKVMIVVTGGEPLLHKELEYCGKELYKRGYPWGMVTNGMAMTQEKLNRLLDSGLRAVTVSLDGFKDVHNMVRGNPRSYDNAIKAIDMLIALGDEIEFDVVTCVNPETYEHLDELKEFLIAKELKQWRLFSIFPIGRAKNDEELHLSPVRFRGMYEFIKKTRQEGRIKVNYGCEGYLGNYEIDTRDYLFSCNAGVKVGSVLVDGSISACPNLRSNFVQGNIYKDDFMDVWNNRYQKFRNREWMRTGKCANCKEFKYCNGNGMHLRNEEGELLFCHIERIEEGERILKEQGL